MGVIFPGHGPSVEENGDLTVSDMLSRPTSITSYISDLAAQDFFLDTIYATVGGVTGGAILFEKVTAADLVGVGEAGNVSPGGEFPFIGQPSSAPQVAPVQKIGGKFAVTDEAVKRNNPVQIMQGSQRLANTVRRGMTKAGINALKDALVGLDSPLTHTSVGWAASGNRKAADRKGNNDPAADFVKVDLLANNSDLGISYDTWIVNPADYANFRIAYGTEANDVLDAYGVTLVPSRQVEAGSGYAVAAGQVGVMGVESPLSSETWRDHKTQSTLVQSWVTPAFAVTNPLAIVKIEGLGS